MHTLKIGYGCFLQVGSSSSYAGHHCSWCDSPEGVKYKLFAAANQDRPRWGDFPEKLDLNYIRGLKEKGNVYFILHKMQSIELNDNSIFLQGSGLTGYKSLY